MSKAFHPRFVPLVLAAWSIPTASPAELIAHYTFDADLTNRLGEHHLVAAGAAAAGNPNGILGGALGGATDPANYLDGLVDQVATESSFPLEGNAPRSLSAWFKTPPDPGPPDNAPTIIGLGNSSSTGRRFDVRLSIPGGAITSTYGGHIRLEGQGAARTSNDNLGLDDEQWHHVFVSFTGGTGASLNNATVLVDGKPVGLVSNTTALLTAAAPLIIGGSNHTADTARNFHGLIDDVGIWSSPLAASDARILHGLGRIGPNDLRHLAAARALWQDGLFGDTAEFNGLVWEKADEMPGTTGDWQQNGGPNGIGSYFVLDEFGGGLRIVSSANPAPGAPQLSPLGFSQQGEFLLEASRLDPAKSYRIRRGTSLADFPETVGSTISGQPAAQRSDPAPPPGRAFYRLETIQD